MTRYFILFALGCGLIFCLYFIQQQHPKKEIFLPIDYTPIVYIDKSVLDSMNRPNKWHIDLQSFFQTVPPKNENTYFEKENTVKTSLFDYMSIGKCQEDEHRADYLYHKLNETTKNTDKNASNGLRIPSCGFIRTKIPFSF